jgi:hypothetical protein
MNRLAFLGAALALLVAATVTVAASPSPSPSASPSATAHPAASPTPTASPRPTASPTPSPTSAPAKQGQTWTADVTPVNVTGTATVVQQADGTGVMTLKLTGLVDEQDWTVDIQAGTIEMPSEHVQIALKQGDDVTKVAPDTITVRLSKDELKAFAKAQQSSGVVVFVSDGTRLSAATFASQ